MIRLSMTISARIIGHRFQSVRSLCARPVVRILWDWLQFVIPTGRSRNRRGALRRRGKRDESRLLLPKRSVLVERLRFEHEAYQMDT